MKHLKNQTEVYENITLDTFNKLEALSFSFYNTLELYRKELLLAADKTYGVDPNVNEYIVSLLSGLLDEVDNTALLALNLKNELKM